MTEPSKEDIEKAKKLAKKVKPKDDFDLGDLFEAEEDEKDN